MDKTTLDLFVPCNLWTHNRERSESTFAHRRRTRDAREAAGWTARSYRHPPFTQPVVITVTPQQPRGKLADPLAHAPVVKACIDGLVDIGLIADDTGTQVAMIVCKPPQRGDVPGLHIRIEQDTPCD